MFDVSRKLGDLLVDRRLLTKDALEIALAQEQETGVPLARVLVAEGWFREEDLLRTVAEQVGMEFVDLDNVLFDPDAVQVLEAAHAKGLRAVPVRFEDLALLVAVADPFDVDMHRKLEQLTGKTVKLGVSTRRMIHRATEFLYGPEAAADLPPEEEGEAPVELELHINDLLGVLLEQDGSDLHLTAGTHPQIRVHGSLRPLEQFPVLAPAEVRRMIYGILTESQRMKLEETLELDTSHPLPGKARFRMNVFFQRDSIGAVFRAIPSEMESLQKLGMPPVMTEFATYPRGLVLVTGPTGSGKSTTLASVIDLINQTRSEHILTIEDPIEFLHAHKQSVVNQREVGTDTHSFSEALKHALRQDPDVILVGELRDLETIATALTAAETGHLVLATLHTQDAVQTVDRVIDVFPAHQQQQVRIQLAGSLQAIVSQQLLPRSDGRGRVPAVEVMIATPAIRNLIREGKNHQITTAMQAGGRYGMQTMDQALAELVRMGLVAYEKALDQCSNFEDFQRLVGKVA
jgi:twitching motility protein PilT